MNADQWLPTILLAGSLAVSVALDEAAEDSPSRVAPHSPTTIPDFLLPFDTDEDGLLSQEELGAARTSIKERKVAETPEGTLAPDEQRSKAREAIRAKLEDQRSKHFSEAAGDDLILNLDEFLAISAFGKLAEKSPERAAAVFAHLDSDGDGAISMAEFLGNLRPVRPERPLAKPTDRERPTTSPSPKR